MKLTTEAFEEGVDIDAIYYLQRGMIHPDPEQPRLSPDAELQASIDSEGIIQPITVRPHPDIENHWMIVDGERRWRGGAHLDTIPCRIRLDLEEPVDRLVTQLSANNSKPLSPVEQAIAFKKILDDDADLSQAALAKRLGIPRSTIGDRIRLTELHSVWLNMLENGELQPSHAPVLHRLAGVPAKYQVEAAEKAKASYWWGENMQVDDFVYQIEDVFKPYIHPLQKGPFNGAPEFDPKKYEGPTVMVREGMRGSKAILHAADPEIWKPLVNAARAAKSKKTREMRKNNGSATDSRGKKITIDVPEGTPVKVVKGYDDRMPAGHIQLTDHSYNWAISNNQKYDPGVLLEHLDRSKLIIVQRSHSGPQIWTTDSDAFSLARSQWEQRWRDRIETLRQEIASDVARLDLPEFTSSIVARRLIANLLQSRGRNEALEDLRDMAAIAQVPLSKALVDAKWDLRDVDVDKWIEKLDHAKGLNAIRALLVMYHAAPNGPTVRAREEEQAERNRLARPIAPFFPELLEKQLDQGEPEEDEEFEADYEIVEEEDQLEAAEA